MRQTNTYWHNTKESTAAQQHNSTTVQVNKYTSTQHYSTIWTPTQRPTSSCDSPCNPCNNVERQASSSCVAIDTSALSALLYTAASANAADDRTCVVRDKRWEVRGKTIAAHEYFPRTTHPGTTPRHMPHCLGIPTLMAVLTGQRGVAAATVLRRERQEKTTTYDAIIHTIRQHSQPIFTRKIPWTISHVEALTSSLKRKVTAGSRAETAAGTCGRKPPSNALAYSNSSLHAIGSAGILRRTA